MRVAAVLVMRVAPVLAMRAAAVLVVLAAAPAYAQSMPGTGGDPLRGLMFAPFVVNNEQVPGLAMRGGGPEDTVLLFDGFELPWAFHDDPTRSIVPRGAATLDLEPGGFGVEYGRGSSVVKLSSAHVAPTSVELTTLDFGGHAGGGAVTGGIRAGWNTALRHFRDVESDTVYDAMARYRRHVSRRWTVVASGVYSVDESRGFTRGVLTSTYESPTWRATLAASPLQQWGPVIGRFAIDTRAEAIRTAASGAGLTQLEWRLGQQTNSSQFEFLDDRKLWRHDIAGWTSVAANLSPTIRATAGLRVDDFDGNTATQPRARLAGQVTPHLELALTAGAYRRPPEQPAEIAQGNLNPERATQVVADATYDDNRAVRVKAAAYYIDRRRLVAADADGVLHNSGFGSSLGFDLAAGVLRGPWLAMMTATLARSRRFDFERAAEHPAPYEQPFKLELLGVWRRAHWTLAARLQLASGLPYTPYTDSIYDSDRDTWVPLYAEPLSARTPFHHQLDVRVDYHFHAGRFAFAAFLDLHNAYDNRDAIAYRFSYDYRERTAISALPVFPFAGLRASL
jgi:hypothetical protein